MWPDVPALRGYLARASHRLLVVGVLHGAAIGLACMLAAMLAFASMRWAVVSGSTIVNIGIWLAALGLVGGVLIAVIRRRWASPVAIDIERRAPHCRNVVITAAELIDQPTRVEPYVGEMVCREAVRQIGQLDPAVLFPARRAFATLNVISVVWMVALTVIAAHSPPALPPTRQSSSAVAAAAVDGVDVIVVPPPYAGQATRTLHDPTRVDALAGSRLRVTVRADGDTLVMETLAGRTALTRSGPRTFTGEVIADADGFIAVEPVTTTGRPGPRRLIGLTVTPDQPPRVTITAPGKDMFLIAAKQPLDVSLDAADDIGLASLTLRYTKVSGSGERFTFVEGEVPVTLTRTDARTWKARGMLRLDTLKLEQGDLVVYRGVAADKRPGAPPTESDAFIVEITSPGMIAAEGFSMDDQQDKYALSQQMVILKTERLLAAAPKLAADSVSSRAQTIAAEQRAVRAQFVFMMGGELAEEVIAAAGLTDLNEEAEAAGEADLAAGRMLNRGRVALVQAIRFMSRANASLNATDVTKALTEEKAALIYLQQAFSRTRYLLRALTQRERLDLSRRLTGVLATAARDTRAAAEPVADPRLTALRRALAGIAMLAAGPSLDRDSAESVSALAQRILAVDPSDAALQKTSSELTSAAVAIARGDDRAARQVLDDAATGLASVIRAGLIEGPGQSPTAAVNRLRGSLSDELRRARGGR